MGFYFAQAASSKGGKALDIILLQFSNIVVFMSSR